MYSIRIHENQMKQPSQTFLMYSGSLLTLKARSATFITNYLLRASAISSCARPQMEVESSAAGINTRLSSPAAALFVWYYV